MRVISAKIEDAGPRMPIFAIMSCLWYKDWAVSRMVVAKIGDAGPRAPIFAMQCCLQFKDCKDWPISPRGRCEDWRWWAQDTNFCYHVLSTVWLVRPRGCCEDWRRWA